MADEDDEGLLRALVEGSEGVRGAGGVEDGEVLDALDVGGGWQLGGDGHVAAADPVGVGGRFGLGEAVHGCVAPVVCFVGVGRLGDHHEGCRLGSGLEKYTMWSPRCNNPYMLFSGAVCFCRSREEAVYTQVVAELGAIVCRHRKIVLDRGASVHVPQFLLKEGFPK